MTPDPITKIVVVAAIIERNDTYLVTRRPDGVHLGGLWEFPGGKVDPGETHGVALVREIREELGTEVRVGALRFHVEHAYPDRTVALYFYDCTLLGSPVPHLGQEMRWVPRHQLDTLGFPPADEELIRELASGVR